MFSDVLKLVRQRAQQLARDNCHRKCSAVPPVPVPPVAARPRGHGVRFAANAPSGHDARAAARRTASRPRCPAVQKRIPQPDFFYPGQRPAESRYPLAAAVFSSGNLNCSSGPDNRRTAHSDRVQTCHPDAGTLRSLTASSGAAGMSGVIYTRPRISFSPLTLTIIKHCCRTHS
jgi:hypothetical protein